MEVLSFQKLKWGQKLFDQESIIWNQAAGLHFLTCNSIFHFKDLLVYTWNRFGHLDTYIYWLLTFQLLNETLHLPVSNNCPLLVPFKLFFVEMEPVLEQIDIHSLGKHIPSQSMQSDRAPVWNATTINTNAHSTTEVVRQLLRFRNAEAGGDMISTSEQHWKIKFWNIRRMQEPWMTAIIYPAQIRYVIPSNWTLVHRKHSKSWNRWCVCHALELVEIWDRHSNKSVQVEVLLIV